MWVCVLRDTSWRVTISCRLVATTVAGAKCRLKTSPAALQGTHDVVLLRFRGLQAQVVQCRQRSGAANDRARFNHTRSQSGPSSETPIPPKMRKRNSNSPSSSPSPSPPLAPPSCPPRPPTRSPELARRGRKDPHKYVRGSLHRASHIPYRVLLISPCRCDNQLQFR